MPSETRNVKSTEEFRVNNHHRNNKTNNPEISIHKYLIDLHILSLRVSH